MISLHRNPLAPLSVHSATPLRASAARAERGSKQKVLILPGFLSGSEPYYSMARDLEGHGFSTEVLKVQRAEWYPTLVGFSFGWYVERLAQRIDDLYEEFGKLMLVGHSAGGWIGRICLGSIPYMGIECNRLPKVERLVTLGAPHLSLEQYPFGRFKEKVYAHKDSENQSWDSSLRFANEFYGHAASLAPLDLITVVGSGFRGASLGGIISRHWALLGKSLTLGDRVSYWRTQGGIPQAATVASFASTSYKANCGDAEVDGDGVTPVQTSLLPGATHIILPNVFHGPNNYGITWYGSTDGINQWKSHLAPT